MTSLFTPDELPRMAKTLKTLETTIDAIVCADESQHVRNHSWDRLDNRKRVKQALRAAKHQADFMLRLMERTDLERLARQ